MKDFRTFSRGVEKGISLRAEEFLDYINVAHNEEDEGNHICT